MGIMESNINKNDKRSTVLNFSKKGQSIYDQIVPAGLDFEAKLMSVMNSNDLEQIHRLLKKLASRLNKI